MYVFLLNNKTKQVAVCEKKLNDNFFEAEAEQDYKGNWYLKGYAPNPTNEEKQAQVLAQAKEDRSRAVSEIIVEVDGMNFDGDEESQTRMGRTIAAAVALGVDLTKEKRTWVLADNSIAEVTVAQLAKALQLAGDAQTELWTIPYKG